MEREGMRQEAVDLDSLSDLIGLLRSYARELANVDWVGGSNGAQTIEDAADALVALRRIAQNQRIVESCPTSSAPEAKVARLNRVLAMHLAGADLGDEVRAAWRAQDITHGHMERFANEVIVANLLFDYLADWLDWGSLTM